MSDSMDQIENSREALRTAHGGHLSFEPTGQAHSVETNAIRLELRWSARAPTTEAARPLLASSMAGVRSTAEPAPRLWRRTVDMFASKSATAPRPRAWRDASPMRQDAGVATAVLFAGLAPAVVMAAIWPAVAPIAFVFTFVIAFCHAVFLGLPLFLIARPRWINVITCIAFGFVVGAAPTGVIAWPMQYPELHAVAAVDRVPSVMSGMIMGTGWIASVSSLFYFGYFGAIGGFAFWVALIWSGGV